MIVDLFAQELADFYGTINDAEERILISAFKQSRENPARASEFIKQMDPKLFVHYNQVFPYYYAKIDSLTSETRHFYKNTVSLLIFWELFDYNRKIDCLISFSLL